MYADQLKTILENHLLFLQAKGGEKADLREADLLGADLRGADLRGADLLGADLRGADLREADLREAYLLGADLRGADLREANLRWANLSGTGIKIFQAGLWTAIISRNVISIGCQQHPIEKWMNFTDEEISAMHPFALEYWNENKDIVFAISQSLNKRLEIK